MSAPAIGARRSLIDGLIDGIVTAYRLHRNPLTRSCAVAQSLEPFLGDPRLLTDAQQQAGARRYRQHVLHVDERAGFAIVAVVWLAGQTTPIHDHASWCAIGVHRGREREVRYRREVSSSVGHLLAIGERVTPAGEVNVVPAGEIHRVENPGPDTSISIHVYAEAPRR
ncbi:MAG TPA: cysteine dioxygenase family protein [Candidatus Polarisedimenticolaceae bacterium]|nr:cysteine dioxygenase family protein [Candidatus Polarisedimenticolaceae bacterium]